MDAGPWTFEGEIARTGTDGAPITLVEGTDFCLSARNGDIRPGSPHGLFLLDTRFLSQLELRVDGRAVEGLGAGVDQASAATFFGRADPSLVVLRRRSVCRGLTEEIRVRNHATTTRWVQIDVVVDGDFADLFEVKENRVERRGWYGRHVSATTIHLGHQLDGRSRATLVELGDGAAVKGGHGSWRVALEPGGEWATTVTVSAVVDGMPVPRIAADHYDSWSAKVPRVQSSDPSLEQAVAQAAIDLGSLRIFDPEFPDRAIVAAGAPWFMSPFGRDSLLTAWMALTVDPDLALGVLETLARFQGDHVDPATEEEPGRILHEMRFGEASSLSLGGGHAYYGSIDATPLFVMLLGELRRWGLADDLVDRLLPHADRALDWIVHHGDRDGDGYVEYLRSSPAGLANQGWKDSWDGIRYSDGRVAAAPIALCEVQGYTYAAYLARAHFARAAGDEATCRTWTQRAEDLRAAFNHDFWLEDKGYFAVGLDAEKKAIDSLASNQGHCLWTGIVDEDKASAVADALLSPAMFNGWGVRTLASSEAAYNPVSYHCGSVWPHDNALIAAGLVRYGFVDHAHRIVRGILDVAEANRGRLPELFSGIGRDELGVPAAYPTSCEPQAWAAATPLLFLRLLLRLDPWVPRGQLCLAPAFPDWLTSLRVEGIPLGGRRIDVLVDGDQTEVRGLGDDLALDRQPRAPITSLRLPA
ncbi:MAG: amylo-alpha-1,6-glucosidase [Acidobacteria bacterium]|nr:amylo-alpha-1,6-glucosidase [Acidobacteriota bacterium]